MKRKKFILDKRRMIFNRLLEGSLNHILYFEGNWYPQVMNPIVGAECHKQKSSR